MMKISLPNSFSISEINEGDKPRFVELLKEKQIYDRTLAIPFPYTESDANHWIQHLKNEKKEMGKNFAWAIRDPSGVLIGGIGLHGFDLTQPHRIEVGYWLGKPYWNRGIVTDAVKAITVYAFRELGFLRITAHVFEFNPGSARVLEKAGFVFEGRLSQHYQKDGNIFDGLVYALVRGPSHRA